jgi:hypothetical protein
MVPTLLVHDLDFPSCSISGPLSRLDSFESAARRAIACRSAQILEANHPPITGPTIAGPRTAPSWGVFPDINHTASHAAPNTAIVVATTTKETNFHFFKETRTFRANELNKMKRVDLINCAGGQAKGVQRHHPRCAHRVGMRYLPDRGFVHKPR